MRWIPSFRPCDVAALLLFFLLAPAGRAGAYTVYGYEDPLGMLHLSRTRMNEQYKPLYEGEIGKPPATLRHGAASPAAQPSHEDLVRLLREKQAIVAPQGPLTGMTNLPPAPVFSSSWSPDRLAAWAASRPYPHPQASGNLMAAIQRHAEANRLDPVLVYCVIEQESGFCPTAVSPKGAQGIMQIMPETQQLLGLQNPFDAESNIKAGVTYLRWMLRDFKETTLALAAYNAGPQNVEKYRGVPPFPETRDYITRILARQAHIKSVELQGKPARKGKS